MKPLDSSPESFRYDEASGTYNVDFVPNTFTGIFSAFPNFWQYYRGKKSRVGRLITLQRIMPDDAALMMEGVLDSLDHYAPPLEPGGDWRIIKTRARMFDLYTGEEVNITKHDVSEFNSKPGS